MISIESHSKQIKLLNDYIAALEKQVSSSKAEIDALQKSGYGKSTQEVAKLKNQNGQLRYQIYKQEEQLKKMGEVERGFEAVRQELEGERNINMQMDQHLVQLSQRTQDLEQKLQIAEGNLQDKAAQHQNQLKIKDKKVEDLSRLLTQERTSTASRLNSAQVSNSETIRAKDQAIDRLTAQIEEWKEKSTSHMNIRNELNEKIRQFAESLNEARNQNIQLRRQLGDANRMKGALGDRQAALQKEIDAARAEVDEANKKAEEALERQNAEVVNRMYDKQYYCELLGKKDQEIEELKAKVKDLEGHIAKMEGSLTQYSLSIIKNNSDLQALDNEKTKLGQSLLSKQKQCDQLKLDIETMKKANQSYSQHLQGRAGQVVKLEQEKQALSNKITQYENDITERDEHLRQLEDKISLISMDNTRVTQQRDDKQRSLTLQIKDLASDKNSLQQQLEDKRAQVARLKAALQNQRTNMSSEQQNQLKQAQSEHQRQISALKVSMQKRLDQSREVVQDRDKQIARLQGVLRQKQRELQDSDGSFREEKQALRQALHKKDTQIKELSNRLAQLEIMAAQKDQGREHLNKDMELLRAEMAKIQMVAREQNQLIAGLHATLTEKQSELQALETSNTALRKQILTASSHEENARKELIQQKKRSLSNSRASGAELVRSKLNRKVKTSYFRNFDGGSGVEVNRALPPRRSAVGSKRSLVQELHNLERSNHQDSAVEVEVDSPSPN